MPVSDIDLNLGQVPTDIEDPTVYSALLDIHNALEILASRGSTGEIAFDDFINKFLTVTVVNGNYSVLPTDGLILVAATVADVSIILPLASEVSGYEFSVKCVDDTFAVTVLANGVETIDGITVGIGLTLYDSLTVKSDGANWYII